MRKRIVYLFAVMAGLFAFSCSKGGDEPFVEVTSDRTMVFGADATEGYIDISANTDWNVTGFNTWCTPGSATSGKTSARVKLVLTPNTGHDVQVAELKVNSSVGTVPVTVKMGGVDNVPPTAPVPTAPADQATDVRTSPTFTWEASTDANGDVITYVLYVSKDQQTWDSYNTRETSYVFESKLDKGAKYYWKVTAKDGYGGEATSPVVSFTVNNEEVRSEGEVMVMEKNTESPNAINVIILGDGFIEEDLTVGGVFDRAAKAATDAFFDIEPYRSHRAKFNVYAVVSESQQRGGKYGFGHDGSQKNNYQTFLPNTSFSTTFTKENNYSTGMSCDYVKCFRYARMVPGMKVGDDVTTDPQGYWYGAITNKANPINNCVIIVVVNDKRYAGTCSFWGSGACIGMCPMSDAYEPTLRHEVGGHGFAKLGDEYSYASTPPMTAEEKASFEYWEKNCEAYKNLSLTDDLSTIKWKAFIDDGGYPEVRAYEGGDTRTMGVWRPERISCMIDNRSYFNGPSRYAIIHRIMKLSSGNAGNDNYVFPFSEFKKIDRKDPNVANGNSRRSGETFGGFDADRPPLGRPVMIDNLRK